MAVTSVHGGAEILYDRRVTRSYADAFGLNCWLPWCRWNPVFSPREWYHNDPSQWVDQHFRERHDQREILQALTMHEEELRQHPGAELWRLLHVEQLRKLHALLENDAARRIATVDSCDTGSGTARSERAPEPD